MPAKTQCPLDCGDERTGAGKHFGVLYPTHFRKANFAESTNVTANNRKADHGSIGILTGFGRMGLLRGGSWMRHKRGVQRDVRLEDTGVLRLAQTCRHERAGNKSATVPSKGRGSSTLFTETCA